VDQDALGSIIYHPRQAWESPVLVLDGVTYHRVDTDDIPPAHAEVPVTLNEYGKIWPVCFEFFSLTIINMEIKVKDVCGSNWGMCE